jgi:hypothetical protein
MGGAPPVINGVLPVLSGVLPLIDEPPAVPGELPLIDEEAPPAALPLVCAKRGAVSASAPATTKHERMSIVIASREMNEMFAMGDARQVPRVSCNFSRPR